MSLFKNYMRLGSGLVVLFWLAGLTTTWAQTTSGFKISGKACVPDQECKADSLTFTDSSIVGTTTRVWDFGDGTTVTKQKDSVARHVYQMAGTYTVMLTRTANGITKTTERKITINNPPQPFSKWRTDTTICKGEKITLDPYPGGAQSGVSIYLVPKRRYYAEHSGRHVGLLLSRGHQPEWLFVPEPDQC